MMDTNESQTPDGADKSDGPLQEPVDVAEPRTEEGVSLLENLNPTWIAWFVIIAIALSVGIAVWLSLYVALADEATEKTDFDQLAKITDPLQAIATLMIGTIFGFTVQSGATAVNKVKANKNKQEAENQHQRATENATRAAANAKVAALQADTANDLRHLVGVMREHYTPRGSVEDKRFITRDATGKAGGNTLSADDYIDRILAKADRNLLKTSDYQRYLSG
jgi:hypothetical protein